MKHDLKISVSKNPPIGGVVQCRKVTLREKILTKLFGRKEKLMILVPDNSVDTVSITEVSEGGAEK